MEFRSRLSYIFITLLIHNAAASFYVLLSHYRINYGITEDFVAECTFERGPSTNVSKVEVLTLSRLGEFHSSYVDVATIDYVTGGLAVVVADEVAVATGSINQTGVSTLSVKWRFPQEDQVGTYKCVAQGEDQSGRPISIEDTDAATGNLPVSTDLINKIISLDGQAKRREDQLRVEIEILDRKLDIMQAVLFVSGFTFNGVQYYLSRVPFSDDKQSMAACSVYGGHLAEIDTVDEYNAIVNYLKAELGASIGGGVDGVVVSGTDEVREGVWLYHFSGKPLKFVDWYGPEPNDGVFYNCLALWRANGYKMTDFPCGNNQYNALYLCEIIP
ncbi:unnamed protein product [Lymnaea stagnalis]|uniref:C-type lectin domain-containing protein n=1 Tax=Lymnaea stagnalis TaxID=6523 RepID=A0AAV2INH7_LYMST